jgi:hypothetical protein
MVDMAAMVPSLICLRLRRRSGTNTRPTDLKKDYLLGYDTMTLRKFTDFSVKPYAFIFRAEEETGSSETSVNVHYITRRSIPENSILRIHGCENLNYPSVLQPVAGESKLTGNMRRLTQTRNAQDSHYAYEDRTGGLRHWCRRKETGS